MNEVKIICEMITFCVFFSLLAFVICVAFLERYPWEKQCCCCDDEDGYDEEIEE